MLALTSVVFGLLFTGGTIAYWIVSTPLKSLPTYNEQMAATAAPASSSHA